MQSDDRVRDAFLVSSGGCAPVNSIVMPSGTTSVTGVQAKLYFMCGKMAAGKSTHAKELSKVKAAVLFVQDELLEALYPGAILVIDDFEMYSARVREVVSPYIREFLARGHFRGSRFSR